MKQLSNSDYSEAIKLLRELTARVVVTDVKTFGIRRRSISLIKN